MLKQGEKKKAAADPMVHLLEAQLPNVMKSIGENLVFNITCRPCGLNYLMSCLAVKGLSNSLSCNVKI